MKKQILGIIVLLLLSLSVSANPQCDALGGQICQINEFCNGNIIHNLEISEDEGCCSGKCQEYKSVHCQNVSYFDIKGGITCQLATSKKTISGTKYRTAPLFVKLMNPKFSAKSYPELWDLWTGIIFSLLAVVPILTFMSYVSTSIRGEMYPGKAIKYRKAFVYMILIGLILVSLEQILSFVITLSNILMAVAVKYFAPNGDLLRIIDWLLETPVNSIAYLFRDILYFLFLILLIIRVIFVWGLLLFSPIFVAFYFFMLTEQIGDAWARRLLSNLAMPVLWVISFSALVFVSKELVQQFPDISFLPPLICAAVIYINIILYRKITKLDFSFRAIAKKVYKYGRLFA